MSGRILAIDPGNTQSGYVVMGRDYVPSQQKGKTDNLRVLSLIDDLTIDRELDTVVIEMVSSYGARVGMEVFDTAVWIGRFEQHAVDKGFIVHRLPRREVKMRLLGTMSAKDKDIRALLVERFAHTPNGKGTAKAPDFFYGFAADAWQAYALGAAYLDGVTQRY